MNLQDKLLSSYLAFQENLDISNPMSELRDKAIRNFEVQGFPTKKEENWKYTSLNSIIKNDFSLTPSKEDTIEFKDVKKYFIHDLDTYN
ncbi:MAG TPA: Fe-S cluster assembly protein SufD, partial [Leeuwenhoekiella sp.]|nr:Fe-S cluster assembly protein SufD [Leeuwenhoekiella sp.]